ncbi:MAG: aroK [Gammaproteobacteria bacterium]|jgi:shikimate kinase|nr:aroK [Gammaproteobacteria bacterium]
MKNNHKQQRIFLLGEQGVGKTSVGRGLARTLRFDFYDVNAMIEERSGVELSWIKDREGEEGIHCRTQKILNELLNKENIVIAAGNNINSNAVNKTLSHAGIVVYLQASVSERLTRLANRRKTDEKVCSKTEQSNFNYEGIADIVINTDSLSRPAVISELAKQLMPNISSMNS